MTLIENNIKRRLRGLDNDGKVIEFSQSDLLDQAEPVVVLGDAGMGKTTLLEEIGCQENYKFLHARRLVRSQDPATLLEGATTLVIDALDELTVQVEGDAVDAVLASLERAGSPNFILACRVADWRSATSIQALADSYGCEPLELILEPIGSNEARFLLSRDIGESRANRVITHFKKNGLEELFGNPQTLKLIKAVAGNEDLPTSRAALFELSAQRLWAEHSQKKTSSSLSQLNESQALNAAGGAFASLILAGKTAISRLPALEVDEDDLPLAEINVFMPQKDLHAVLASRLLSSSVEGNPDRFSYTHRSVGEFLAARWLAERANTDRKRRRLLKLFHSRGLVPASLRGIHAWLARDPRLALDVIAADPMGVVEYGETGELSDEQARALLNSLFELGDRDPRYFDFEKTHSMRGIAKPSLCPEIKNLIVSRSTPFPLRAMLLHSVSGSQVATMLSETLEEMVLDPDVSYYERRVAGNALTELPRESDEWARIFSKLHDLADESSLRLAIELLPGVGFVGPTDAQIVELIVAFCGLSICAYPQREKTRLGGVLWGLEKRLPEGRIAPVLDILADYLNALFSDHNDRHEDSDAINVVYTLTERHLAIGGVDPLRLWRWLSSLGDRRGFRDDSQKTISNWLNANTAERREIQRLALLEEPGTKTVWMRGWRLNDMLNGLYPDEDDVIELLGSLDPSLEAPGDRWKDLVRLCPHDKLRGECVRDAAAPFATDKDGREFLDRLANPQIPEWQIKQEKRDRKRKKEKEERWAAHRANFLEHIDDLRNGKYSEVVNPAQAYLNLFSDMGNDVPAHQRIEQWLGPELQEAAFQGFEAFLTDEGSKPTAKEIADSYAESKRWNAAYIFVAAVAERIRNGKPLDDLSDERLLAVHLEIRLTQILDHASIDQVSEVVEKAVKSRPGLWEAFWRLRIEPQLAAQNEHVDGLYEIARGADDSEMATALASEWLERFPKQTHRAEVELIDCLIAAGEFEFLKKYVEDRRKSKILDEERRSDWDAVAFLVDFENVHNQLSKARGKDPKFLWNLRSRLSRRHDEGSPAPLSPAQLSWIIKKFRPLWQNEPHPRGMTSGDANPWDAAEYLGTLINRLGSLTSPDAVKELLALRDAPRDGYTDHLKRTFAEQAQKVVEDNYTPPTIAELVSVLSDGSPHSADQLQAVMLEELTVAQQKIRSHPVDWHLDFFENAVPKNEEACRDTLLKMFGDYPYGILCEPEGHLADDKRADIKCTIDQLMLPIEIKGQWHKDLWHAADTQLDRLYSNDWRAERKGIYLVFWFGPNVPKNKKLKSRGKGSKRPTTAEELRLELVEHSEVAKQGRIEIVVLDMVRP
ncbi:NACHT domain-containing protein [Aliiroseovarius sp. CAU 1755]